MLALSLLLALALPAPGRAAPPPPVQGEILALRVERIVAADGKLAPGGWIVVRNGRLEALNAASAPAGAQILEFPHGVACAGFIDPVTALGSDGDLDEPARAFTPEAQAADSFRPHAEAFAEAIRGGVTTIGLAPTSNNVAGGRIAVIRCASDRGCAMLHGAGPLRFCLTPSAFRDDRTPTSRMGALPLLRQMLADGKIPAGSPCVVEAGAPDEIRLALETFGAAQRQVALLHPLEADEALELLKGSNALAIVGPFGMTHDERTLRLPGVLDGAGIPVAFTAGGSASALRLTAALAVRSGLAPEKAMQALSAVPARILGVDGDSGTLEAGKRADLLVFSGDPLDLSSKLELVLAGGLPQDLRKDSP